MHPALDVSGWFASRVLCSPDTGLVWTVQWRNRTESFAPSVRTCESVRVSAIQVRRAVPADAQAIGEVFDAAVRAGWTYLGELVDRAGQHEAGNVRSRGGNEGAKQLRIDSAQPGPGLLEPATVQSGSARVQHVQALGDLGQRRVGEPQPLQVSWAEP
jgi:hypothetical protein